MIDFSEVSTTNLCGMFISVNTEDEAVKDNYFITGLI